MKIACNICKSFNLILNSKAAVNLFCLHVLKCPSRSDDEFADRYKCSICETVLRKKRSFQDHIQKHIRTNPGQINVGVPVAGSSKDRRQEGKYESFHSVAWITRCNNLLLYNIVGIDSY